MKSFKEYLQESKNVHMTHIEDIILLDGAQGAARSLFFLDSIIKMLSPSMQEAQLTLKWDGSPAVIAGIDPESGKFFVGTKAVFSKGNPRLNFSNSDIDKNHAGQGDLPSKLKAALKYLPKVWKKGVFQGDLMFTKDMLKKQTIDGDPSITFKPNTITYASPIKSDLGKKIAGSDFGIVFHTRYTGKSVPEMKSSFNVSIKDFKQNSKVWFDDAEFKDVSTGATFSNAEASAAFKTLKVLKSQSGAVQTALKRAFMNKGNISNLIQFNNARIKAGDSISNPGKHYDMFVDWVVEKKAKTLKSWSPEKDKAFRADMKKQKGDYVKILSFWNNLRTVKKVIISKLNKIKTMKTFVQTDSGYKVVGHEGFVAITNDGSSVKLVDRMEFSKNNFTADKSWSK